MNLRNVMQSSMPMRFTLNAPSLHAIVRTSCRQRAAAAALALPVRQRGTPRVLLAHSRNRDPEGLAKTEGKIKGPARTRPQRQSARGVDAARRLIACVPSRSAKPQGIELGSVPSSMRYAILRWSLCHDLS